jgi:acetyl esterase/lipase
MKPSRRSAAWRLALYAPAVVAALTALAAPARAQAPAPLPSVETFFRNADVGAMKLSPSGKWLAMTAAAGNGRIALAVADVEGKAPIALAAAANNSDVRSFEWVDDERLVFNVVDTRLGGTDQRFGPGLFSVRRDGKEMRELIKPRDSWVRDSPVIGREALGGNHELLMIPRDGSGEVLVGQYQWDSWGRFDTVIPLRLDVTTGRTRPLSIARPEHVGDWYFDPKGEPRVAVSTFDGVTSIHWRAPGQEGWTRIATGPSLQQRFRPRFVDETGRLFVTANVGREGTAALKLFDFAAGAPEPRPIVTTPGFDFSGGLVFDAAGDTALGVRVVTDAETTVWFEPRMQELQRLADAKFPGRINTLSCSRCKDPQMLLVFSHSDQDPGRFWLYRPQTDAWTPLGAVRRDIVPARMAPLDFMRAKVRDGLDLPIWLTTPRKDAPGLKDGKRAAVVLVHGGPWVRGGQWAWDGEAQFLASRGYVVIEPEFRGSTGYGAVHFRAGWKKWEGAMQDDVADALNAVVAKGLVDPKRVCIAGASYGGYATLMGMIRYPELYRCGVAWVAVTDPRLLFENPWENDSSEEARNYTMPSMLGHPQNDAAMLKAAAPVERAAELRGPLLLAYGRDDRRVPIRHGTVMREALRAQGREPEWIVYDDEGHGWFKVANRIDFWTRVERFLDAHIGPNAAR